MPENSGATQRVNSRNVTFAAIFVVISAAMGYHAYDSMDIGTLDSMGPGFFPLMLSILLALLGIGVGFTSLPEGTPPLQLARIRPLILTIGSPLIFAATIRTLGLLLSILLTVFIVSFASRHSTLKQSAILSVGFTFFCVLLFKYLLNVPIPLWGSVFIG